MSQFPKTITKNINYNEIYNEYFDFIIDTLNLNSFYVMGNSLGGLMSWNLTLHQPNKVKKLVLLNSAGYDMKEVMKTANAHRFKNPIFKLLMKKGIPKFITAQGIGRVFYEKSTLTDEKIQRVNDFWNKEGNLQQIINMANSNQFIDEQLIKNIKVPTLIIWGKEDIIVSPKYAEKFHQDIQNSELIIYEKCGHVPMLEAPDRVYQDVQTFFDK